MENLPLILFALACPIGMGLMMFFMMRPGANQRHDRGGGAQQNRPQDQEIAQLREQIAQLRADQERRSNDDRTAL